jgi:hypothetical protein
MNNQPPYFQNDIQNIEEDIEKINPNEIYPISGQQLISLLRLSYKYQIMYDNLCNNKIKEALLAPPRDTRYDLSGDKLPWWGAAEYDIKPRDVFNDEWLSLMKNPIE